MRAWAPILLIMLIPAFAGCLGPDDSTGEPWSHGRPDWWVAASWGCGFCDQDASYEAVGYAASGHVLIVQYGRGEGDLVSMADDIPIGLRAATRDLMEAHLAYGKQSGGTQAIRPIHVVEVEAIRVATDDVNDRIQRALQDRRPATGTIDVTDCGPDRIESFDPVDRAQDGCGIDGGSGWKAIRDQLAIWG